ASLQHLRSAGERPRCRKRAMSCRLEITSGKNEAFVVEGYAAAKPVSPRRRSGHHEYMPDGFRDRLSADVVAPGDSFKFGRAFQMRDLCIAQQFYIGILCNALDQIPRHCFSKSAGTHQHVNLSRNLRNKNRSLTSRVSAADHHRIVAGTELRLDV